jgi:hypothetical protein
VRRWPNFSETSGENGVQGVDVELRAIRMSKDDAIVAQTRLLKRGQAGQQHLRDRNGAPLLPLAQHIQFAQRQMDIGPR